MEGNRMKKAIRTIAIGISLTLLLVCGVTRSKVQSNAATLMGTVLDNSGAVISYSMDGISRASSRP